MEKQSERHVPSTSGTAGAGTARLKTARVRNVAFKGLVILFSLLLLATFNVVFLLIVVVWLPDTALLSIMGEDMTPADLVHRVHDSILPVMTWSVLIGTLVQLYRPERRQAPLLMALAVPATIALVELTTGTYTVMGTGLTLVPLILIALLHPRARQLLRIRRLDRVMAGLMAAAAVGWLPFAYRQAQLQRLATPGDTHATMEHWNRLAAFALFLLVWSLLGASDRPGWRLTAWMAGLASAWFGLQSLLFPTAASATPPLWAVAAVVWGLTYIVVTERRARAAASQAGAAAAQPA